jgi:hypothetical protein
MNKESAINTIDSTRRGALRPRFALAIAMTFALASLAPGTVLAGKPSPNPTGSGTVAVNPNPVAMGAQFTVTGSGFSAGTQLTVKWVTPTATSYRFIGTDANGRFSITDAIWERGTFPVEVWQSGGRKSSLKASTSLTVQ